MVDLVQQFASLNLKSQSLQLVIAASTFMRNGFECVIGWSIEDMKLIRPVTNVAGNSWKLETFTVGCQYEFVIVDSNPSDAIYPHKSEDIIVGATPDLMFSTDPLTGVPFVPVNTESQMYNMLFGSSVESVYSVFAPGVIYEGKYIIEGTECPSVGILQCNLGDIMMYKNPFNISRCRIFQVFDFPVTAQNRDALLNSLNERPANTPVLVLLGLGRPFAGTGDNVYNPRRCYILVIGVIMQGGGWLGWRRRAVHLGRQTAVRLFFSDANISEIDSKSKK